MASIAAKMRISIARKGLGVECHDIVDGKMCHQIVDYCSLTIE